MTANDIASKDNNKPFDNSITVYKNSSTEELTYNDNNYDSIWPELLTKYLGAGFKLVPVGKDSKTPAVDSTNEIYNNTNYWTEEKSGKRLFQIFKCGYYVWYNSC